MRSWPRRDELERVNEAFVACVQAATGFVRRPLPGTRWGRAMRARHLLEEFFGRHLAAKREGSGDDLFSTLCSLRDDEGRASPTPMSSTT